MTSVRREAGTVYLDLEAGEAEVLISLAAQVIDLLGPEPEVSADSGSADSLEQLLDDSLTPVEPPDNDVLARLLPDAYRDDDAAAQEFRRLTDADLRGTKRAGLSRMVADMYDGSDPLSTEGTHVELDTEAAKVWLYALTDVRLAFGTGIGVREEMDDEYESLDPDSQRYAELSVYGWLGYLQESVVMALSGE